MPWWRSFKKISLSGLVILLCCSLWVGSGTQAEQLDAVDGFQFKVSMCHGLTNQRIQLLDGVLAALFLGAQIVLPQQIAFNGAQFVDADANLQPLEKLFNLAQFQRAVQSLYRDFWCRRGNSSAFGVWCLKATPCIVEELLPALELNLSQAAMTPEGLMNFGELARKSHGNVQVKAGCDFWFKMKVKEGTEFWEMFWKLSEELKFSKEILDLAQELKMKIFHYGALAREHAKAFGYLDSSRGYHVVHLRAELDWQRHCEKWESYVHKRDNCMNNTFQIGDVLISERISPSLPVYLATGLSVEELGKLKTTPSMQNFFSTYTVVTKEMLGVKPDVQMREFWAAIDFALSEDAEWFVGNSISTFSAFIMEARSRSGRPLLPYNGGKMALEEIKCIRPKQLTLIPPLRPAIKWVFILRRDQLDKVYNMTLAAVASAFDKTSLVPVCVSDADPQSDALQRLTSMGVRVIYHTPSYVSQEEQWIYAELPLLGLLDEFVLYTDTNVLFLKNITWKDLIGPEHERLAESLEKHMFGRSFFKSYASPGSVGVPKLISSDGPVRLLNLRGLRDFNGPKLQKGLKSSALPEGLVSNAYKKSNALMVHFSGPKCHDIVAYLKSRKVTLEQERHFLEQCRETNVCEEHCKSVQRYLTSAREQAAGLLDRACSQLSDRRRYAVPAQHV